MRGEDPMALAQLAADAVVSAAVTNGWETTSHRLARLLGHGDPAKTKLMEQHLAETREQLIGVRGTSLETARAELAAQWVTRLTDLLEEDPVIRPGLHALVEEIHMTLQAEAVSLAHNAALMSQDMNIDEGRDWFASRTIPKDVMRAGPTSPGLASS
jgi:hypothetical protein